MKLIHVADVHLGAVPDSNMPWGEERKEEIWSSFQHVIDVCNEEEADLLLIAGDMFDRQPLVRELKEVNYYFSRLKTAQVVIIAGNHDFIAPRSNYQGFEWIPRVHMIMGEMIETVDLPEIHTKVYGLSYHKREISEPLYDDLRPCESEGIHILLAHGGDEKHIPMNRKKIREAGFDYVACGHLHTPVMISDRMAFTGSMEPQDRNEVGERGFIVGEIIEDVHGNRHTSIRYIPSSLRQYQRISLSVNQDTTNGALVDQARELIRQNGQQHIYHLFIRGFRSEEIHFDKAPLITLGNILEVVDESVPDYDFDAIARENADNILGMFIQRIRESKVPEEAARKAMYYGVEALLGAKDR